MNENAVSAGAAAAARFFCVACLASLPRKLCQTKAYRETKENKLETRLPLQSLHSSNILEQFAAEPRLNLFQRETFEEQLSLDILFNEYIRPQSIENTQ